MLDSDTDQSEIYKNMLNRVEGLKRNYSEVKIENLREWMYKKAEVSTNPLQSLAHPAKCCRRG